jgi:Fur family peroxide stress response transcriptional regulator
MDKKERERTMDSFREACKAHGLKVTPQRTLIYEEFVASLDHPTIDTLYKKVRRHLPNVSFDTVYRTVLTFAEIGLASQVDGYGGIKRFDPNMRSHHHFRCARCNTIVDFYNDDYDAIGIPADLNERFIILNKQVHLEGLCEKCRV